MKNKTPTGEAQLIPKQTRREFIRKAAYTTPVLLSFPVAPSFAQQGSGSGTGTGGPIDDPIGGPTPISELNCDEPLAPIDSDIAANMCELTFDSDSGELFFQDVIVSQDAVPGRLSQGDLLGTCDSFLCNAS